MGLGLGLGLGLGIGLGLVRGAGCRLDVVTLGVEGLQREADLARVRVRVGVRARVAGSG